MKHWEGRWCINPWNKWRGASKLGFLQIVPVIGPIVAIITGHMAKSEIKKSAGTIGGDGMATAGLILGYITIVLGFCLICVLLIFPLLGIGLSLPFFGSDYYY
ncbi:MAG: DUF4190 domain-containing protein [Chloroflexota bacterium]